MWLITMRLCGSRSELPPCYQGNLTPSPVSTNQGRRLAADPESAALLGLCCSIVTFQINLISPISAKTMFIFDKGIKYTLLAVQALTSLMTAYRCKHCLLRLH